MEYNYPPDLVESAIKQRMEKIGLKAKSKVQQRLPGLQRGYHQRDQRFSDGLCLQG